MQKILVYYGGKIIYLVYLEENLESVSRAIVTSPVVYVGSIRTFYRIHLIGTTLVSSSGQGVSYLFASI